MEEIKRSEDSIQAECWQWLYNTYPKTRGLCFHIRNGGSLTSAREGNKFKAMGVVPGVPDICLAIPQPYAIKHLNPSGHGYTIQHGMYGALYIEMKTEKGKHSTEQKNVQAALIAAGNRVEHARSLEEFKAAIYNYLGENNIYFN
jgi:hypothetical protein